MNSDLHNEYQILRQLELQQGELSQRRLAKAMDCSLGKVNYVMKALVEKGFVELRNFCENDDKRVYKYLLTPEGLKAKYRMGKLYLQMKIDEYERLQQEIELLRREVSPERDDT
ncbi:MarR family EPS-associated transcriptional regulator [Chrysiogenes arsenatis]|uniref:MarR family EPS-associated transcriptional regulator n=1 Tax=Chrysiogenes arsenatis TaxID=309797 RepID=UPI0003F8EB2D|nr:MarR family EPS-associated transcriptional regulator [Chrysiogenes arsenatis]